MATNLSNRPERAKRARISQQASGAARPPSEATVRILAYELYEQRRANGAAGDPESDWVEAERRLSRKAN